MTFNLINVKDVVRYDINNITDEIKLRDYSVKRERINKHRALEILAKLARDTETDVSENNIILQSGIPRSEVQIYLNELESRRLANEVRPSLWTIKDQG